MHPLKVLGILYFDSEKKVSTIIYKKVAKPSDDNIFSD